MNKPSAAAVSQDALPILAEEQDFLVINKPVGLAMHNGEDSLGLISLLREQRQCDAFYPVHRLDKATSGIVVVAKNKEATRVLSEAFENRRVEKYYWAISDKKPRKKQGAVSGDMARTRNGCWKLTRSTQNPAITHFFSFSLAPGLRAFLLKPYTGKTHQLRVALKSLGAPILGDERYGGSESDRMYLHSSRLSFDYLDQTYAFSCLPSYGCFFQEEAFVQIYEQCLQPDSLHWPSR